jgi:AraC-like DNA-binding protein
VIAYLSVVFFFNNYHLMKNKEDLMERILIKIDEGCMEYAFTVDKLASSLGMCRTSIHRAVVLNTGNSTTRLINQKRLVKAHEILKSGNLKVNVVANLVGFRDAKYFSTLFKKEFGYSPREVRK